MERKPSRKLYGTGLLLSGVMIVVMCWPLLTSLPDLLAGDGRIDLGSNVSALGLIGIGLAAVALAAILAGVSMLFGREAAHPKVLDEAKK